MSAALETLATLRMKVMTTFLRRIVVLVRSLEDSGDQFPLPDGLRPALLDGSDFDRNFDAYRAFQPHADRAVMRARLAAGDLCFAALEGDQIVHATWASPTWGPLPYLDADAVMEDGDVCLYDSYTVRTWRGRDVSRARDEICRRHYRALGMRRTVALIARENAAGLRTTVPLGYRVIGEYGLFRLGPLRRRWTNAFTADRVPRLAPRSL